LRIASRFSNGSSDPRNGGGGPRRIAIVLPVDTDLIDIAGPACVFSSAARCLVNAGKATAPPYILEYLSVSGGAVGTRQGLTLDTRALGGADAADYDTIIVTGGDADPRPSLVDIATWLACAWPHVRRIASVCTGAFFLAHAGLLKGKRATTHWMDCGRLAQQFRSISVDGDAIFVEDEGVWTSAGATAGIDMALAMVEQDHGHDLAMTVARMQVVFLKRHGGQSQYSLHLQSQQTEGPLAPLLQWIVAHPDADLTIEALADRAHMSLRNFYRCFEVTTGQKPAAWVEGVRIENAKRLLGQTVLQAEQIALKSGFGGYERMRRAFTRRLGISPLAYRGRFAPRETGADRESDFGSPSRPPPSWPPVVTAGAI
jgi:transcriptional regulator GlxA family with amidase domain